MGRYTEEDKRDAALLGVPHLGTVAREFLDAVKAKGTLSAREMHRQRRDVPLLAWMEAAAHLHARKLVVSEWRPLHAQAALQEAVYTVPPAP